MSDILSFDEAMFFSDIVLKTEERLGISDLKSVVSNVLKWGINEGLYTKVERAYYKKNKVVINGNKVSWNKDLVNTYINLTTALNDLSLDMLDSDVSELTKVDFKTLSDISKVLNACISYCVSKDVSDLKTVLNTLK